MYIEASKKPQVERSNANYEPVGVSAQLKNDSEDLYDVRVFEYTPATRTLADGTITKTYVYSTDGISPRANGMELIGQGWDDSYSVYGSITMVYNTRPNATYTEYLLTRVFGGWERSDTTVSMSNRYVAYTSQYVFALNQVSWKYPTSNSFDYSSGYTQYIPDDGVSSVLGALCSVDLAHGSSSRWTLTFEANLFTNDIGDLI